MTLKSVGALLLGVMVVAVAFLVVRSTQKSPEELLYEQAARNSNIPLADYQRIMDVFGRIEKDHTASDGDWDTVKSDFNSDNPQLRELALSSLDHLGYNDKHRDEAVQFAKSYLNARHPSGNIVAVVVLHNLRDPSWKDQATRIQNSDPDPEAKDLATRILKKFNG